MSSNQKGKATFSFPPKRTLTPWGLLSKRWRDPGGVCGWGWATTPESTPNPRNTRYWTSGSAVAPSTVRAWEEEAFKCIVSCSQFFWFCLDIKGTDGCQFSDILHSLHENSRHWLVGSSVFPLLGYSLSDIPVKAKRSALNYSLPITFNKSCESECKQIHNSYRPQSHMSTSNMRRLFVAPLQSPNMVTSVHLFQKCNSLHLPSLHPY